jgi:hypothetical protein
VGGWEGGGSEFRWTLATVFPDLSSGFSVWRAERKLVRFTLREIPPPPALPTPFSGSQPLGGCSAHGWPRVPASGAAYRVSRKSSRRARGYNSRVSLLHPAAHHLPSSSMRRMVD